MGLVCRPAAAMRARRGDLRGGRNVHDLTTAVDVQPQSAEAKQFLADALRR